MDWIQLKYLHIISSNLPLFKIINNNPLISNFRCIYCGDSKKTSNKKRAYLLEKKSTLIYYCHNCGYCTTFENILKYKFPSIYTDFVFEKFKEREINKSNFIIMENKKNTSINLGVPLSKTKNKYVIDYIYNRKIDEKYFDSLYYVKSVDYISRQIDKYKDKEYESKTSIVIPFYNKNRDYRIIILRVIDSVPFRYMTFDLEKENLYKLWGLEFIDFSKSIYICEGVFDAMMIPNALASGGANISSDVLDYLSFKDKKDIIFIYDNDYLYNAEILKMLEKRVDEGYSVVIYDEFFKFKDLNEAVMKKFDKYSLLKYLENNTYYGLSAKLRLSRVKRK